MTVKHAIRQKMAFLYSKLGPLVVPVALCSAVGSAALVTAAVMVTLTSCEFFGMDALSIVGHSPEGALTDLDTLAVIEVYFSADADKKLTERAFSLQEDGVELPGTFSWPEADHLSFRPRAPLNPRASYEIKISADAEDVDGNSMDSDFSHAFRGSPDSERPLIRSFDPANLSVISDPRPIISIEFSEAMYPPSVVDAFHLDPDADGYLVESADNKVFTYVLIEDLSWQTVYTMEMGDSAVDASGNSLNDSVVSSFFVGSESERPTVLSVSGNGSSLPLAMDDRGDGAETVTGGLEKDAAIVILFSETMDPVSTEGATAIVPGSWSKAGWNAEHDTLTFEPDTNLEPGGRYTLTVGSGASDSQGNLLGDDIIYVFEVTGPRSRRPIVSAVRFLNVFDGTGTPTDTIELTHAGAITLAEPFSADEVDAFVDVYLVLAESAVMNLYDFIEAFSIRAINADIDAVGCKSNADISFHAEDIPPIADLYPSSSLHVFRYAVRVDNSGSNADKPGYIILSLDPGLEDSLGNSLGDSWSMMVTTTN